MLVDFPFEKLNNKRVAVAISGGCDSMALLNYMLENAKKFGYSLLAINVEHGIRGEESVADTEFVKAYCACAEVPLKCYAVDSVEYSKKNKLSLEESARKLRYDCFYSAICSGFCDVIATAHHQSDNVESILFNLFRGTGLNGVTGIQEYGEKIIRPLLHTSKQEILDYAELNDLPYVTDSTNLCDEYTRNHIRLNVLPEIKKAFPEVEKCIDRFSKTLTLENEFLNELSGKYLTAEKECVKIKLPVPKALMGRCVISALKLLGISKDWQKTHIDDCIKLAENTTGKSINLLKGVKVIKQYDNLVFFLESEITELNIPLEIKTFEYAGAVYSLTKTQKPTCFKNGHYLDYDKIPQGAQIRTIKAGDVFTKFGGKTKKLADYFTDIKLPLRERKILPIIAKDNIVYAIFGAGISNLVAIDDNTKNVIKITKEER